MREVRPQLRLKDELEKSPFAFLRLVDTIPKHHLISTQYLCEKKRPYSIPSTNGKDFKTSVPQLPLVRFHLVLFFLFFFSWQGASFPEA